MAAPKGNKYAEGNRGGGRKPLLFTDEMKKIAIRMAETLGATDEQLAEVLGVSKRTIDYWKTNEEEFFAHLKEAKVKADMKVARALRQRALGYSHPDVHITAWQGEAIITDITKHYPPDTAAAFIWLKNRQGWRDKQEVIEEKRETKEFRYIVDVAKELEPRQRREIFRRLESNDSNGKGNGGL